MIIDKSLQLASGQGGITTAATTVSENTIDLTKTGGAQVYKNLWAVFRIKAHCNGGTAMIFQLISSAAANLGSPTVLVASKAIPEASLTDNTIVFKCKVPAEIAQRYLGAQIVSTGTFDAGTFDIFLTPDVPLGAV